MSYYDHGKFTHPVPAGFIIPQHTKALRVETTPYPIEMYFTTKHVQPVYPSDEVTYYLDYDITAQKLPTKLNSVIYNVRVGAIVYPVAVYQGGHTWSAFIKHDHTTIFNPDIESFDTTPPEEEADA